MTEGPTICTGGRPMIVGGENGGILLPLGGDFEKEWPDAIKAILYFIGLCWCFMGVAIVADVFMGAIEKVTSKKVTKKIGDRNHTSKVWNDTVANLTLMALGSSAPEILLSLIELVVLNGFHSGELGPSTIVGSAAFNLFVIIAVCVVAIPREEKRTIKDTKVFYVTAFFSIFAYVWLIIILQLSTPDVVDVWEALVTFFMFPLLVTLAYYANTGKLQMHPNHGRALEFTPESTKEDIAQMMGLIRKEYGNEHPESTLKALMEAKFGRTASRAHRRVHATRKVVRGKQLKQTGDGDGHRAIALRLIHSQKELQSQGLAYRPSPVPSEAIFEFLAERYCVLESCGSVKIQVTRSGNLGVPASVLYKTKEGSAHKESDYVEVSGLLNFAAQEITKFIEVHIVEDKVHEDTEEFYVELYKPSDGARLGDSSSATITIVDDDNHGVLTFASETIEVDESAEDKIVSVKVNREEGSIGTVSCTYCAEDGTAMAGHDYELEESTLEFAEGQVTASFQVTIKPKGRYENDEYFRIILKDAKGAHFNSKTDGDSEQDICIVKIKADPHSKHMVDAVARSLALNWDAMEIGNDRWKTQFQQAFYCNGSKEDQATATWGEIFAHLVSLPWKLLFAMVPPTDFAGGWVCFVCSLAMIGIVTAVIGDMANLLGCAVGLCPGTTAITLVALGTSLPDTFASKMAAVEEEHADSSIGNVTGSNSVNVFLGLGLPWVIGAVYWKAQGATVEWMERGEEKGWPEHVTRDHPNGAFVVPAGSLVMSVTVFSVCAFICLATLQVRRFKLGGELGGPKATAMATGLFLCLLWVIYLVVSILDGGLFCSE